MARCTTAGSACACGARGRSPICWPSVSARRSNAWGSIDGKGSTWIARRSAHRAGRWHCCRLTGKNAPFL
ncbi:hypothetical protein FIV36_16540 [Pseudomonas extremaustralis]|uniref:Uncharacterized protein n=1 Tax=Pseudomonas extremaustralis TaxID=359110 RepID=A0A5C5QD92_9PSED|nr:hypothetical protein FIV36_16540 [Pseudomonas extremaustralis]